MCSSDLKSFRVSGLTFSSLIHFEFIFVYGVRKCSNFILLHVAVQFSQVPLIEESVFSPLYILAGSILRCFLTYPDYLEISYFQECITFGRINTCLSSVIERAATAMKGWQFQNHGEIRGRKLREKGSILLPFHQHLTHSASHGLSVEEIH